MSRPLHSITMELGLRTSNENQSSYFSVIYILSMVTQISLQEIKVLLAQKRTMSRSRDRGALDMGLFHKQGSSRTRAD
jgi:hypothetical protein